jgi:hypothetical protein
VKLNVVTGIAISFSVLMYEYTSLFIYGLSSDSASSSGYVAPNGMLINE